MTEQDLNKLLSDLCSQPAESQWLEFKLNNGSISNNDIGEYISAMSNGATIANKPFGYFVCGVQDSTHEIAGTSFTFAGAKEGNQDLELWLRNLTNPKVNIEIFEFDANGKHIVLVRIPAAKTEPTTFKGIPYIRIGSHKTDLRKHIDLIRIIYNSQEDWSAKIIHKATINDLVPGAIKLAREKFKEKNTKASFADEIDSWSARYIMGEGSGSRRVDYIRRRWVVVARCQQCDAQKSGAGEIGTHKRGPGLQDFEEGVTYLCTGHDFPQSSSASVRYMTLSHCLPRLSRDL